MTTIPPYSGLLCSKMRSLVSRAHGGTGRRSATRTRFCDEAQSSRGKFPAPCRDTHNPLLPITSPLDAISEAGQLSSKLRRARLQLNASASHAAQFADADSKLLAYDDKCSADAGTVTGYPRRHPIHLIHSESKTEYWGNREPK